MHRRQQVRDAAVAVLQGMPLTGGRVYGTRTRSLEAEDLPAIRVYTPEERADGDLLMGAAPMHRIEIRMEVVAKASDSVEDTIDAICEALEARIETDPTLGGKTAHCAYQSTEIDYEDEDQTVMQATLSFEAAFIEE